ncbi:cystatin-F-like [Mastacembelus armatus]|uniref:cystatin-F-like n=1 Tax=Mastacembelus armatus TaxID=205130 RepID=UPI000E45AB7C|nr:cystatin-F-like [Mastacembelus armatus]XP_026165697.1 cystatin-F-like [Mastacembelus armatus]XP_026165701.1 cystatin-F-like [Mastacembelus armatus]XP_026165703.1 cystatin-F-like [Mastacembelus armatus]
MFVWFIIFVCASVGYVETAARAMPGQPTDAQVNSPQVLAAASFAVDEFNRGNLGDPFLYKIVRIKSAKVQVVAGLNFFLKVQLGRTTCRRSGSTVKSSCNFQSPRKDLECQFTVTEVPWEGPRYRLMEKKCTETKV